MSVPTARSRIHAAVTSWPGVETTPHRFGGTEYRLGTREVGHVHGDRVVDIPFPKRVRDEVVAAGEAERHHTLPESGWVSFYLREAADVEHAVRLLRRSYDLAQEKASLPERPSEAPRAVRPAPPPGERPAGPGDPDTAR